MDHVAGGDTEGLTANSRSGRQTSNNGTFVLSNNRKSSKPNWKIVIAVGILALLITIPLVIYLFIDKDAAPPAPVVDGIVFPVSKSPLGVYRFASVASDAGRCSQVGTQMLVHGGSAVDAAIAACLCTGIYNMHNAGIGGGFFMTIWDQKSQKAYAVDAREVAPLSATEDMFVKNNYSSLFGPFSIAVPGEIAGYWEVHKKFGKLPWEDLFAPTVKICNDGIEVSDILQKGIDFIWDKFNKTKDKTAFETAINFLTNPKTKAPYRKGETIKCPVLAETLSRIGKLGGWAFYNGSIADDIVADLRDAGSPINRSDLAAYSVSWRKPVEAVLQDRFRMISIPPPGSGPILAFILNILSGYNLTKPDSQNPLTYHRFIEALKFGYGQRAILGDESFVSGMDALVANLTSPVYGEYVRSLINDSYTHPTPFYMPDQQKRSGVRNHGTAHISIIDADGNAVSITSTVNLYFGSGIVGKRTGIIFNNEMDDFSSPNETNYFDLPPSPENFIKPGKRPQSSMCPAVILARDVNSTLENAYKVRLVVGAAGGSRITSGTAYVAARILWFGEDPKRAVDALRFHHQLIPEKLYYEHEMPKILLDSTLNRGHVNQSEYEITGIMSAVQAVQLMENGTILANSDYRKNSFPDGI